MSPDWPRRCGTAQIRVPRTAWSGLSGLSVMVRGLCLAILAGCCPYCGTAEPTSRRDVPIRRFTLIRPDGSRTQCWTVDWMAIYGLSPEQVDSLRSGKPLPPLREPAVSPPFSDPEFAKWQLAEARGEVTFVVEWSSPGVAETGILQDVVRVRKRPGSRAHPE